MDTHFFYQMKMTKRFLAFSIWILLFVLLHQANSGPNDPVNIPDPVLRAEIENRLGKMAGTTITESELNNLTGSINARSTNRGGRVMQLTGLEHATSTTQMTFSDARITDLSPLTGLTQLQYLDLRNNGTIADISPLSGLTGLQKLWLRKNKKIVDISPLSGLTTLTVLYLGDNQITDISPLKNLTNLTELGLSKNRGISDISILKGLTKLEILGLNYVNITQEGLAAVLPSFSALRSLVIGQTNITDLSVLRDLPSTVILENLDLIQMGPSSPLGWHLKDLSPLVSLMNEGRVVSSKTVGFNLRWNFGLDYESLYTDIPALIAGTTSNFAYSTDITPTLEAVSPKNHVGRPGTAHTFVVRASNTTIVPPGGARYTFLNNNFEKVPVTFTVTAPDGTIETHPILLTGVDGLASVSITLGNDGETHIAEAVVPAKQNTDGPSHEELRVRFTATADSSFRLVQRSRLRVTFEDYPEEKPTDEFTLTLKFSESVIGFEKNDISLETELTRGTGTATLEALTPIEGPA
ncbi:leucine-rich repeat domain-containing protein, partial [Candidatus Poribacteria bacterium]|nr:leucine-rich repeat domain-containing protein [Candidatus Poribacteria bacterium]